MDKLHAPHIFSKTAVTAASRHAKKEIARGATNGRKPEHGAAPRGPAFPHPALFAASRFSSSFRSRAWTIWRMRHDGGTEYHGSERSYPYRRETFARQTARRALIKS